MAYDLDFRRESNRYGTRKAFVIRVSFFTLLALISTQVHHS